MAYKELALLFALFALAVDALSWKNCDANAPVQLKALSVKPTPIQISAGTKITLSGSATVSTGGAGLNYRVEVTVKRKLASWFPVWVTVPCVSDVGSCTYTGLSCEKIWKELGKPVTCPVPPGNHNITTSRTVPHVNIPSFLTSGHYWAHGKLIDTDNSKVIACIEIDVNIA